MPPLHTAADAMPRQQSIIVIVSSIVEEPFGVDMINCGEKGMSEVPRRVTAGHPHDYIWCPQIAVRA